MDLQFSSIPVSKANRMAKSNIKVGVCVWRGGGAVVTAGRVYGSDSGK